MTRDARHELGSQYREFCAIPFPKLGYKVDGFPEAGSVLAGFVTQAMGPRKHIALDDNLIVSGELVAAVATVCQQRRGSQEATELEAYVEKMKELERAMRSILSQAKG
jgi:hypothetical protein